jgi:hypothetical protein
MPENYGDVEMDQLVAEVCTESFVRPDNYVNTYLTAELVSTNLTDITDFVSAGRNAGRAEAGVLPDVEWRARVRRGGVRA